MNCQNCKTPITCGCQIRTASNGQSVCQSCLARYEHLLAAPALTLASLLTPLSTPA